MALRPMDASRHDRSLLDDLGEEVTGIIAPVSLCMALTVLLVKLLNPEGESASNTVYIASIAYAEDSSDSSSKKFGGALLNAIIFVSIIAGMTFVLFFLFKYGCYRVIFAYMGFAVFNIFFFITGALFINVMQILSLHIDAFSLAYGLFNFSVVGTIGLLFVPIPLLAKQAYLIWVGVITAYIFTFIPEWTSWVLLVLMALYDIAAVLIPGGPLKALVEIAIERNQELPALIYEARPAGGRPYVRGWGNRTRNEEGGSELGDASDANGNPNPNAQVPPNGTPASPSHIQVRPGSTTATGPVAEGTPRGALFTSANAAAVTANGGSNANGHSTAVAPNESRAYMRQLSGSSMTSHDSALGPSSRASRDASANFPPGGQGIGRHRVHGPGSSAGGAGPLGEGQEQPGDSTWQALAASPGPIPLHSTRGLAAIATVPGGTVSTPTAKAHAHAHASPADSSAEFLRPLMASTAVTPSLGNGLPEPSCQQQQQLSLGGPLAAGPLAGPLASGGSMRWHGGSYEPLHETAAPPEHVLCRTLESGGSHSGRLQHHQQQQHVAGVPAAVAPAGAGPPGALHQRQQQHEEDMDNGELPDAIKLGLGDFIFYSMLVGRAAMYDFMTVFSCYLAIIAGLGLTLLCLAIFKKALPALPFSIALGVVFYFLTRLVLEPYIIPLSTHYTFY